MCFPLDEEEGGKPPTKWLVPGALDQFQPAGVTADWQKPGGVRLSRCWSSRRQARNPTKMVFRVGGGPVGRRKAGERLHRQHRWDDPEPGQDALARSSLARAVEATTFPAQTAAGREEGSPIGRSPRFSEEVLGLA